ncbi:alpha-1,3-galactosidase-related protein [Cellulophaga omnivescoria]|uniref:alpha-1,3-galactosidase-related protein n=1 Tax=Cellulophaga omnivescoria TaxID=1888890 RepID=UPI0022EFF096|nr:right-handed parallel beta-helix repeat-containing protein [Cellulophaga omnivescoria]WBU89741.1 right-handed parallel beta-helix repeat-containing protein [Cellulophaga omnivescoria]
MNKHSKNNTSLRLALLFILVTFVTSFNYGQVGALDKVLFKLDIAKDATPNVLARILKADKLPISEISFEKGTYHFYPDLGLEKYVHISNHNDVIIKTAFPIQNFKNLTIDGQGSTFIFHGRMIPFLIDNSTNITVKNVTVDWAVPFHSEATIIANNKEEHTFDIKISDEYPYEIRNQQLIFVKEYYEHDFGQAILFDPKRKAISFNTEAYTSLALYKKVSVSRNLDKINYKYPTDKLDPDKRIISRESNLIFKEIKPGIVRIYNHKKKLPEVGKIIVSKGEQQHNRLAPAFRVSNVIGFFATNVNVHHAGGMGLIAENSENLILDGFNVTASNGRMVSTSADATHFVGCRGKVVLKNSTFSNQLDDATNVHGTYQIVQDIKDEYTLGIRMGHFQQQGFVIGRANDKIGFLRLSNSFFPYAENSIKSIQKINSRYQIITFNKKLPENLNVGDLIENLDAYPELTVENCTIKNNRARGLLISTPKKTVIKNNFFSTEMEAVLIPVESGHWYESGSANDLLITGNTFQDCQHSGFNRGVIRFDTDDDNANIAFKNVTIENNTFNQFDNLILQVKNTDGLLFTKNIITNSGTFPQLHTNNPAIRISHSKNIQFKKNIYKGKASKILETDASVGKLTFK